MGRPDSRSRHDTLIGSKLSDDLQCLKLGIRSIGEKSKQLITDRDERKFGKRRKAQMSSIIFHRDHYCKILKTMNGCRLWFAQDVEVKLSTNMSWSFLQNRKMNEKRKKERKKNNEKKKKKEKEREGSQEKRPIFKFTIKEKTITRKLVCRLCLVKRVRLTLTR